MAYAPSNIIVDGIFTEEEYGKCFEYIVLNETSHDDYSLKIGATHTIFVGPKGESRRYTKVHKTVAYVAVDEDENGVVWERWFIKRHKIFQNKC